ncbi:hypothetical protein ACFLT9_03485 [Acidobacteriota bacterium]
MKKLLLLLVIFVFFVGGLNAQGVRDDDSYYIYFSWTNSGLGGNVFVDAGLEQLAMCAVRTSRGFNVYAKDGSPNAETGDPITDHSAWPSWYSGYGWDTPDADPSFNSSAPFYLISLDTYQGKWWFFYSAYPKTGIRSLYVPMSGKIKKVEFNADGTVDMEIEDDKGDWACYWSWGIEAIRLQDKKFLVHLDLVNKEGYIAPKKIAEVKKPKKNK